MRKSCFLRWPWWACAILFVLAIPPARAQWEEVSSSVSLNGISLGANYLDVIRIKGLPHYIGPSLETVIDVNNILKPSPQPTLVESSMPTDGAGMMMPPVPGGGGMQPVEEIKILKGRSKYIIWLYEGQRVNTPDPDAGWATFVVLDRSSGVVTDVVVWLTNPAATPKVETPGRIKLGSSFAMLIDIYGYPKPFRKIGPYLVCPYLDQSITFSVNSRNGKVIGISIGKRALTVLPDTQQAAPAPDAGAPPAGTPAGTLPGTGVPPMRY